VERNCKAGENPPRVVAPIEEEEEDKGAVVTDRPVQTGQDQNSLTLKH